ncbi:cytochrome c oxidase assembly protein CtaG [Labrys miyagiensis]|uniref:Cytochrome c oxidase assembly protein CtaG n=1 Tax=Labrys miyagiensis TaxID=346912 RepID=A0ABQ6CS02_9HYPH|nr:cytochrome c oxidase assembly protein [Labrys miyagiensis]GLS22504.1 cytochrome c oxidase assembly protein CtaG [Labrys miyagiensis]
MSTRERPQTPQGRTRHPKASNGLIAVCCLAFVASMVGAAYASVPLYTLFCKVTGFGGTTRVAEAAPAQTIDRSFEVRFDSNINPALPWKFEPEQRSITVKAGEVKTIYYKITNLYSETTWASAAYNVTPQETGAYFSKIQCFCFTSQSLAPGESRELPVVFFVDPAIDKVDYLRGVKTITLSYTYYPAKQPATPVAAAEPATTKPQL